MFGRKAPQRQYHVGQLVMFRGPDDGRRYILLDFLAFTSRQHRVGGQRLTLTDETWTAQREDGVGDPVVLNTANLRPVKVVK